MKKTLQVYQFGRQIITLSFLLPMVIYGIFENLKPHQRMVALIPKAELGKKSFSYVIVQSADGKRGMVLNARLTPFSGYDCKNANGDAVVEIELRDDGAIVL